MGISFFTRKLWLAFSLAVILPLSATRSAFAISIFDVSIDTTALTGVDAHLAFDLIDGDPLSNFFTITDFSTDGTLGTASSFGGPVTGTLPGTTTIEDAFFFNELLQPITFGTMISFTLELTENNSGALFPDQFSFFLLDSSGFFTLFPTSDPTGAGSLFVVDIDGTDFGDFQIFSPTSGPAATLSANPVPEPSSLFLLGTGVMGLGAYRRWRQRKQSAHAQR